MSLDFQRRPYLPRRTSARKRTTYGLMNNWIEHLPLPSNEYLPHNEEVDFSKHYKTSGRQSQMDHPVGSRTPRMVGENVDFEELLKKHNLPNKSTAVISTTAAPVGSDVVAAKNKEVSVTSSAVSHRGKDRQTNVKPITGRTPYYKELEDAVIKAQEKESKLTKTPVELQYYRSGGFDDHHRAFLKQLRNCPQGGYPAHVPPRLRNGKAGGSWRHVKDVLQARGSRIVFLDGGPRIVDNSRLAGKEIAARKLSESQSQASRDRRASVRKQPLSKPMLEWELGALKGTEKANFTIMR